MVARQRGRRPGRWRVLAVALSALIVGACVSVAQSASPATTDATRQATQFLDSLRRAQSIPGMVATVVQDGRTIWSEGSGLADRERGISATPETKFRVGSVSKLFTAAALLRLADAGVLDLDAPISRYLQPYPAHWPVVTLRQLAGHTAGVRHYRGREFFSTTSYPSLLDAIGIFTSDTLLFAPGTRYFYSSYGYNLIGAVMESVVGEPFPAIMERVVFAPLGMSNTVPDSAGRTIPGRAVLYRVSGDSVSETPEDDLSSRWPSGGYLSTTADLVRFGDGVRSSKFLSPGSLEAMFTPQTLATGDTTLVGIGWRIGTDSTGRRYFHHGGSSNGGAAFLLVYPRERLVVAMASNAFTNWSTPEALPLASFFLP
jgi:serine beta-lactamase-like protein LACTB, mitochondrial